MLPVHKKDNKDIFPGHKVKKKDMSWKKRIYDHPALTLPVSM